MDVCDLWDELGLVLFAGMPIRATDHDGGYYHGILLESQPYYALDEVGARDKDEDEFNRAFFPHWVEPLRVQLFDCQDFMDVWPAGLGVIEFFMGAGWLKAHEILMFEELR